MLQGAGPVSTLKCQRALRLLDVVLAGQFVLRPLFLDPRSWILCLRGVLFLNPRPQILVPRCCACGAFCVWCPYSWIVFVIVSCTSTRLRVAGCGLRVAGLGV
jgi:hypothetical protein